MTLTKKNLFLLIVVVAIAFLIAPIFKASAEVNELNEELLCDNNTSAYNDLFTAKTLLHDPSCHLNGNIIFLEGYISYLARHENSPPALSA